ncbi:hypothetical protein, partial [Pseudomonas aeruginosa]|uniref:hypothetical protein n=1 Tax=Pseudomonas aeruginosa TaxID=287 RepID=UPI0039838E50
AAALVDLSTVAGNKISNPPWVKFQSAGWVNFPSAPTCHQNAPIACLYCHHFEPLIDAPWETLMASLKADQNME